MIKSLFILAITIFLYGANDIKSITKDIKSTSSKIKQQSTLQKQTHAKLNSVVKKIKKHSNDIKKLNIKIKNLQEIIDNSVFEIKEQQTKIERLKSKNSKIIKTKQTLEQKLIDLATSDYSFSILMKEQELKSKEDILKIELFNTYKKIIAKQMKTFSSDYEEISKKVNEYQLSIQTIQAFLTKKEDEKNELKKLKIKQSDTIKILSQEKQGYKKRLKTLLTRKANLQNLLSSLNVMKRKKQAKRKTDNFKSTDNVGVRQLGSSYQKVKIAKYRGTKYSSPLKNYTIIKKFGTYIDPVYNMKIFNDSIVLGVKSTSVVRSVNSGEIVFAKDTPTLNKVVIIKHKNGIHTIYANLKQIPSAIKVQARVPKGYVIGKVSDELVFQVTKKDSYINPNKFIRLNANTHHPKI
jgi:septal ring factor EnvC (AmiA/AmiB activator)